MKKQSPDEPKIKLFNRVAAIVVRDGCVLTHEALNEQGQIYQALPGGKLEPDETAIQCLVREMREEFAIAVEVDHLAFVGEGLFLRRGKQMHEIVLYFVAHLVDPEAEVRSQESKIQARWLPIEGGLGRLLPQWLRSELPRLAAAGWEAPARYLVSYDLIE
ncbi:MAG TPA: NUDIX domain-containing protein [Herpetosiphonaceae bacterium]